VHAVMKFRLSLKTINCLISRTTLDFEQRHCFMELVYNTVRSEIRCALRLRYVDLVVSIEVAVEACCFTVFIC
jgi:hypothetical protein